MYQGPEFRQLRYFIAVAEECNFGRAARRLRVAQPSVSLQIKQLEEELKMPLFLRGPAGVSLTSGGQTLLPLAKQILAMMARAVQDATLAHSGANQPFRFGYSPWINQEVIHEAISGYKEMVPGGRIEPSSHSSESLYSQVVKGSLDGALLNLPIREHDLLVQFICAERLLICLRSDDLLAQQETIPKEIVQDRLRVMFERDLHPLLYDQIMRKLARAGIALSPLDFVSTPADMQFLVKENAGFGLVREDVQLDPELTRRPIPSVNITVETAFITHRSQQRPVLPLLAYRLAKSCADNPAKNGKKPVRRAHDSTSKQARMFG